MAIREDILAALSDYRGVVGWNPYLEAYSNTTIPHIEIPLYIKESSLPNRRPTVSEVSTIPTHDPGGQHLTGTNVAFFGAPAMLQIQISGWTITPVVSDQWAPVDINGTPLGFGQLSYNDIIGYFLEGRLNRNISGAWQRKDPDYYISPRGMVYINPIIQIYQPQATVVQKKQGFDITMLLES